mmetsp:Transcript_33471/g.77128  ORF Transcript_33471/g.77128 Transcript_33471/m.77128 type:complete len:275 (-) Transcript_33471:1829-2653(-)|eukprot:CAMPEP_0116864540 /NCGR_PEP_ID=MMETSP0418-20121206/24881_1 /TAXON_ID=1158023 /ORGANISM="Astrosyne radiata, Strain 13vi08-1A" /LENGTH=274 /DNA_ID=CAMNT_0004499777 /DNA_START=212 /DNA_END=1036 /DNA_ORIENTATION=+
MTASTETTAPNLDDLPFETKESGDGGGGGGPGLEQIPFTEEDLPPLRMNASRVPERLSASTSALNIPSGLGGSISGAGNSLSSLLIPRRRRSLDLGRSRSRSPSLREYSGDSSTSSLEELDQDILTDRMGLEELDLERQKSCNDLSQRELLHNSLTPVSERLSDETLEDVHAFSDLPPSVSRGNSVATIGADGGSSVQLETLDEAEENEEDLEVDNATTASGASSSMSIKEEHGGTGRVQISNMENLTIEEEGDHLTEDGPDDVADMSEAPTDS